MYMNAADSIRAPMASARKSNREESSLLIKQTLAKKLRDEIIHGRLALGERIVEGNWARRFGVALPPLESQKADILL